MAVKKLILHIGAHKTGTTYIQKVLLENHGKLLDKGILYPKRWTESMYGHHSLMKEIREQKLDQLTNFLENIQESIHTVILSSENLEDLTTQQIQSIAECIDFTAFNVSIVYYIRQLTSIIPSQWQENIKHGSFETFPEFVLSHITMPFNSKLLNYTSKINNWSSIFGKDSVKLVSYDDLRNRNIDIVKYFVKNTSNTDIKLKISQNSVNRSLEPELIEVIRILNHLRYQDTKTQSLYTRYYLLKLIEYKVVNLEYILLKLKEHRMTIKLTEESFIFKQLTNYLHQQYGQNFLNLNKADDQVYVQLDSAYYINSTAISTSRLNFEIVDVYKQIKPYLNKEKSLKDLETNESK